MNEIAKQIVRITDTQQFRELHNPVALAIARCFHHYISSTRRVRIENFVITLTGFYFNLSCGDNVSATFGWTDHAGTAVDLRLTICADDPTKLTIEEAAYLADDLHRMSNLMRYLRSVTDDIDRLPNKERGEFMVMACNAWRQIDEKLKASAS